MAGEGLRRIVVFGDALLRGEGLGEAEKIHALVAEGLRARRADVTVEVVGSFAHAGATIGLLANGRRDTGAPPQAALAALQGGNTRFPSVLDQVEKFEGDRQTIDLVLIDGGLNDVTTLGVLASIDDIGLARLVDLHCGAHMNTLLTSVVAGFPNAHVVVLGYPLMLSESSGDELIRPFLIALALLESVVAALAAVALPAIKAKLAANCALFHERSGGALAGAVDAVNRARVSASPDARPRVHLAAPRFDRDHAALAPRALIAGADGVRLAPLDPAGCLTRQGAKVYADEILAALDGAGLTGASTQFPQNFLWGAATAAYQVEGKITDSDWDVFTTLAVQDTVQQRGELARIFGIDLQPPGIAINHRDLPTLRADLDRMQALSMNAYRFSIEWASVERHPPTSDADVNTDALGYYDDVLSELERRGMEPVLTLNHLTLPGWVLTPPTTFVANLVTVPDAGFEQSLRGWEDPRTVDAYVAFVRRIVSRFGSRVRLWVTLNEPVASMIGVGYIGGLWSPGFTDGVRGMSAYFNLLRAHARAYDLIKDARGGDPRVRVGIAHAMMFAKPVDIRDAGGLDSRGCSSAALAQFDYFFNWHFLDSLTRRHVNLTLRADNREPQPAAEVIEQHIAALRATLDGLSQRVQALLTAQSEAADRVAHWLADPDRREQVFEAWRDAFANLAGHIANQGPIHDVNVILTAKHLAEAALNLVRGPIKATLQVLGAIAGGVAAILCGAADLAQAERQFVDAFLLAVQRELVKDVTAWGLPARIGVPDLNVLAQIALDTLRNQPDFVNLFQSAMRAVTDRREAQRLLDDAGAQLRALAALLPTLLTGFKTSEDFFGAPFRRRLDFVGVNYYRAVSVYTATSFNAVMLALSSQYVGAEFTQNFEGTTEHPAIVNDLQWEVFPRGLFEIVRRIDRDYDNMPVLVTENGMPDETDRNRAAYVVAHLEQLQRASREGVRVLGYLHWSIADNFEWFYNYDPKARFGLFTVDRTPPANPTLERHITEGAFALHMAILEQGVTGLADGFGSIHPLGRAISAPLRSPGRFLRGAFGKGGPLVSGDKRDFSLYLTQRNDGAILGLLFTQRGASWHRLHVVHAPRDGIIFDVPASFSQPLGLAPLVVRGTLVDGVLAGNLMTRDGATSQPLTASVDALAGNWLGDTSPRVLQIFRPELGVGLGRVKALGVSDPQPVWVTASSTNPAAREGTVACAFGDVTSDELRGVALVAALDPVTKRLQGTSARNATTRNWTATRLPDGLPWT